MILAVASAVGDRGPGVVSLRGHMVPSSIHESGTTIPALGVCYHCSIKTDELLDQEYLPTDVSPDGGPVEIAAT